MNQVTFDGTYIRVNGKKIALYSGEFHYWRNIKKWWKPILQSIKDLGLNVVSTYVCWAFHETAPGRYDFKGATDQQRDLDGFLKVCKEMGMYVIVRPGPYIYSEFPYLGIPKHAAEHHRLHPEFLKKAEHYLHAVCEVIRPHLATNGGPVVVVQSDNEVDMLMCRYDATKTFGFFEPRFYREIFVDGRENEPGTYRNWLKRKYGTIDQLNAAWGTSFRKFANISEFSRWHATPGDRLQLLDTNRFFDDYSTEYLQVITELYRKEQIDVPLCANTYGAAQPMDVPQMQKVVDIVGTDHYAPNMMPGETLKQMGFGIRRSGAQATMRYVAEFMSGIVSLWTNEWGFGIIEPQHHRFMGLGALWAGAQGWNWYMFVEREEWYFSPINERGEIRLQYGSHFKDLIRICKDLDWPSLKKISRAALFWYRPHHYLSKDVPWRPGNSEGLMDLSVGKQKRNSEIDRTITALHGADVDYDVYDPYGAYNRVDSKQVMFVAGLDFIEPGAEKQLLDFARTGGTVVFFGGYPHQTVTGKSSQLARLLPPVETAKSWGGVIEVLYKNKRDVIPTDNLVFFDQRKLGKATPIFGGGGLCGCVLPEGKGRLMLLGFNASSKAIQFVYSMLGIREAGQSTAPGVLTAVWRKGKDAVLLALNSTEEACEPVLEVDLRALGLKADDLLVVTEKLSGAVLKMTGKQLAAFQPHIAPKDGLVFHIARNTKPKKRQ